MLWVLCALLCASLLFSLQYRYDNKYQADGVYGKEGVLDLRRTDGRAFLSILTYGWEVYPQELLAPEAFSETAAGGRSPIYAYLGQYGGFETGSPTAPAHGCATYRLRILLPSGENEYALELPEIYSASKVWINGDLVSSLGDVGRTAKAPSVRTGMVTFHAAGEAEIVVQAADFTHYYSGMVYPPAFGTVHEVADLLSFRLLRAGIMLAASLTVGLLYLLIGLKTGGERHRMCLFALVSLSFSLYICYPLLHQFGAGFWSYRLEDVSFYLFLAAIAGLHCNLCGITGKKCLAVLSVCGLAALLSFVVPELLLEHSLKAMLVYSAFVDGYKLLLFCWLIVTAFFNREQGDATTGPLLAGLCVFAAALLFQEAAPVFEPVRFGWQTENAGFVFVLLLAGVLWFDTVKAYARRTVLNENIRLMKKQFALQEDNYRMITGNFEEMRRMRHDLRHHFSVIKELAAGKQYEELAHYAESFEAQAERVIRPVLCENQAANAILNYYMRVADQKKIPVRLQVSLPRDLKLEGWQFGILLGNLFENAIEASEKLPEQQRLIRIFANISEKNLLITVKNRWNGDLSFSGGQIASTKHEGKGIGLASCRSLTEKNGGQFYLAPGKEEFEVSIVLWKQI